ncbi:MAG: hypothetical protein ACRDSS_05310 [Actinocrinis sp.]
MSELETRRSAAEELESANGEVVGYAAPQSGLDEAGDGYPDAEPAESDADLLAIPPRADDLGAALAARPPRLKLPRVTTSLVAAALICVGFIGGALVQKHLGSSGSGNRANFASAFGGNRTGAAGGTGGFGRGGFGATAGTGTGTGTGATAGGAITGTVTVVSGDTLYVTAADGSVYTVKTTGSTSVNISQSGSLSQLKPGQSVVIAGSDDGKGDVAATSITAGSPSPKATTNSTSGGQ